MWVDCLGRASAIHKDLRDEKDKDPWAAQLASRLHDPSGTDPYELKLGRNTLVFLGNKKFWMVSFQSKVRHREVKNSATGNFGSVLLLFGLLLHHSGISVRR